MEPLPASVLFASGSIAGLVEAICVQPLDMVKTRFQLSLADRNPPIHRALKELVEEGGVRRLYRGCMPELASTVAARSAMYLSYDRALAVLELQDVPAALAPALAGCAAGIPEACATTPLQVVKVRLQSRDHLQRYRGPVHCLTQMLFAERTPLALFSGLRATMLRNSVWNGVYFGTMPAFKSLCVLPGNQVLTSFLAGFCGGAIATCCNAPFDVAKSRLQQDSRYRSTFTCLATLAREEGIASLYKGFAPKVLRMACGGGIGICMMECLVFRWQATFAQRSEAVEGQRDRRSSAFGRA